MNRQAVIETGSWTVKAGLWAQTFIPTTRIPSFARIFEGRKVFGGSFADAGSIEVLRPVVNGKVVDFQLLEDLWRHVLGSELGLMEPWTDVQVLLIIPPSWGRDVQAECLRICFEKFGLAGVYIGEAPVLSSLGCAQASSIVVDFGHVGTDISIVWDGHLLRAGSDRYHVGGKDVDELLAKKLAKENIIPSGVDPVLFVRSFKESAKVEKESVLFKFRDEEFTTKRVDLFELASSLYFNDSGDSAGLHHFINTILKFVDAERRPILLDSVVLTGLASQLPGLEAAFTKAMSSALPVSGFAADHQSSKLTLRHVPEYYPEVWRAAGPVSAWFGAGITAKLVFPDSKAHYTREEYSQLGALQLLSQKPL